MIITIWIGVHVACFVGFHWIIEHSPGQPIERIMGRIVAMLRRPVSECDQW